eukprot:TRINITY_DN3783_c0_g1_i6.p1 TRINITY_DN3783_c0_g1~~TRINITY_DN3783_c0_g1_i6.p1  ORF type:complete len:388 (-),score=86.33 TRINITY_DN3783_c0_g1_i6:372-1535(-)
MCIRDRSTQSTGELFERSMLPRRAFSTAIDHKLQLYASKAPVPVSMLEMFEFAQDPSPEKLVMNAQFLHNELPVRVAQRVWDLRRLPHGLSSMPSMITVRESYERSFDRLVSTEMPTTVQDEESFFVMIEDIKQQDTHDQEYISSALRELIGVCTSGDLGVDNGVGPDGINQWDFSNFLDKFYLSRISLRMLMGQYLAIHGPERQGFHGIIQEELRPADMIKKAASDAGALAGYYYGEEVEIDLVGDVGVKMPYVPAHLYYILFEIIKNSMRAVCEFHAQSASLPPIMIVIAEGEDEVAIKVADQGGGIPRNGMNRLWTYAYTTANDVKLEQSASMTAPMAGFGHGLPLSRLYTRYFGGNIDIMSLHGFGTDVYIHLSKLGTVDEQF